jgi:hypothetical protein
VMDIKKLFLEFLGQENAVTKVLDISIEF